MDDSDNLKEWLMRVTLVIGFCLLLCGGCSYIKKKMNMSDDWWGEELLEDVIENKTGISADLTPSTPEL